MGEPLRAPLRFHDRPVGHCAGGRRLPAPSSHSYQVLPLRSRPFARPGERRVDRAVSTVSFDGSSPGAPLDRRLFSVEDADPPRTFSGLEEPSPEPRHVSDALIVTSRHARVDLRVARCACRARSRVPRGPPHATALHLGA